MSLEKLPMASCGCQQKHPEPQKPETPSPQRPPLSEAAWNRRYWLMAGCIFVAWVLAYKALIPGARLLVYDVLGLSPQSATGAALEFFLYDTAKIFLLLAGMVYVMGWLRAALSMDRLRTYLAGKRRGMGYAVAALFGAVTPFCSCSSIPLFFAFTSAGIPAGITLAFLITSPIINEVAVVLLWDLIGWKIGLIYIGIGLTAGILGGWLMDALKMDAWLAFSPTQAPAGGGCACSSTAPGASLSGDLNAFAAQRRRMPLRARHAFALAETKNIVAKVWVWVILGVALGAGLHGFVPETWFAQHLGAGQWWTVPAAVAAGIPLYANVTGIVPVMESLLAKGLPLGTTLAFCMATVAASLPEILMLKQVMRVRLLGAFLAYLIVVFTLTGWMLNLVQAWII